MVTTRSGRTTAPTYGRRRVSLRLRTVRPRVRKAKYSMSLLKSVKAILGRQSEKKMAGLTVENTLGHNASITSADCYSIVPPITQGVGYNQRIGDKIKPTSLTVEGSVAFNDYGQGFIDTPLHVVVFILQAKKIRDPTMIPSVNINALLDNGQGATNWDGSTLHSMYPINRDEFDVLGAKVIKIGDTTAENPKCMTKRYSMKVKTPSNLVYDQGVSTQNNFAPFVVLGWCRDDGVPTLATDLWIKHTCVSRLYYTDA